MHHALRIHEVLLNIFAYCRLSGTGGVGSDLPALARTCRAFQGPALDELWKKLANPSPLAKCLPDASYIQQTSQANKCYAFSRPLTQIELDVLRSYARRIFSIVDNTRELDWESVRTFLGLPITETLFPNLRYLYCGSAIESKHFLCMPFPSLIFLGIGFRHRENLRVLQGSVESFSKFSRNIRRLSIHVDRPSIGFSDFLSSRICGWQNLQSVVCDSVALGLDALVHLSRMPALERLVFSPSATLPDQIILSNSPLVFSCLHELELRSDLLDPISQFLSQIQLPAITDFRVFIKSCPSKLHLSSFFAGVRTSVTGHTIQGLRLEQRVPDGVYTEMDPRPILDFEDLEPCTAFHNLHRLDVNIEWKVDLTDDRLLALTSAWPGLKHLMINEDWGWNTPGGITPDGLLQLLRTCRSLSGITLAIDTRGYTEFCGSQAIHDLPSLPRLFINVVDSIIEQESVLAVSVFLAGIALRSNFGFCAWDGHGMVEVEYMERWYNAYNRATEAIDGVLDALRRRSPGSGDI